jgi:hypothetical protein
MFHDESLKHMLIDHHQDRIILYRLGRLQPRAPQASLDLIRGSNLFSWRRDYFSWRPTRWRKKSTISVHFTDIILDFSCHICSLLYSN